ncbi:MAG TPA: hypothetical protein VFX80_02100 [Solirubrobacteraceae bacterium]|nr:hypothetical protein [Solirubrobacteraceae bacterium]
MPTEPDPVTLAQLVNRAAEITDPDGADDDVTALMQRFEDADWPVSGILESIEQRMAEAAGALDPQEESPGLQVAAAVTVYLAHRRDEVEEDADHVLRMATRAEFDGKPPAHVANWLESAGIEY